MAYITVTNTFVNGATADATAVNTNFTDLTSGLSDGTKDINVNAGTFAGAVLMNGNVTLGNATADDVTFTASLASSIPVKTTASYDIGSSTLGLLGIYFGRNSQTVRMVGSASMSATWTFTLPVSAGSANQVLKTDGSGVTSWGAIDGLAIGGSTPAAGAFTTLSSTSTTSVCTSGTTTVFTVGAAGNTATQQVYGRTLQLDGDGGDTATVSIRSKGATIAAAVTFAVNTTNKAYVGVAGTTNSLVAGSSSGDLVIRSEADDILFTVDGGSTVCGKVASDTTWTIGKSAAAAVSHVIQNNGAARTLYVQNNRTNSDTDGNPCITCRKGSTTTTSAQYFMWFEVNAGVADSGYIGANGANNAAFYATSDGRWKEDVRNLDGALEKILKLRPVDFKWKGLDERRAGFIAQEAVDVFPQFVSKTDDGQGELGLGDKPWAMTEGGFVPYLVAAIQELAAKLK